jgi:hypothetical protein
MIENLPSYVSVIFILVTFFTVGFFLYITKRGAFTSLTTKVLGFLIPFWLFFQATLALGGFYLTTSGVPPRLALAVVPPLAAIILLFIFSRPDFIRRLPLKQLTWLSIVRVPVEVVLFWLYRAGQVPAVMTFGGRNFDILSGISACLVAVFAFRGEEKNKIVLAAWNCCALILLLNVVVNALLAAPTEFQAQAFDQANRAILYFPFIWLPAIIVPIVMFTHFASLYQLATEKRA